MNAPRSGLGRGLAALIPTAESAEHADLSAGDQLFYNLVQGGLDQIDTHTKCDLLAYVHQPHNDEPSLFLRRPGLDVLTAVRAYRLFNHFDRAVRSGANEGTFTFDDTVVIFLRTLGAHSDGFHFIGRTDGVIEPRALGVVRATTHSFATICNQFVSGAPDDLPVPHIVVELDGTGTSVAVTLDTGATPSPSARASANDAAEAVVRAVLAATGSTLEFREARETPINGTRAVLVVLSDERGVPRPGFVVSDDDLIQATATAALRAIYGG
jgi:hypothetical protein